MTDKEIIYTAKEFTKGLLNGRSTEDKCFMVCSPLAAYLSFCGVECTLTEGVINHCGLELHHFWITLSDGRIIDPTADQFGLLNTYCKTKPSYYRTYNPSDYDREFKSAVTRFNKNVKSSLRNYYYCLP